MIPVRVTKKKLTAKAVSFFNDVCLAANDVGCANDVPYGNDVASLMFWGKHRIIATNGSNIIMQGITSYRRRRCIIEMQSDMWYN